MRGIVRTLVLALVVGGGFGGWLAPGAERPAGAAPASRPTVEVPQLPGKVEGAAAVDRLGSRLPSVAADHGKHPEDLRKDLLADPSLKVDRHDNLLYVDPPVPVAARAGVPTVWDASISTADAFDLHSKAGATRVLYLDFTGRTVTNTMWNEGVGSCVGGAFDTDGDPTTFSSSERAIIVSVWRRVAEDFVPFDLDVTTADPGDAAIDRTDANDTVFGGRVLITKSAAGSCANGQSLWQATCASSCGGVSYVGVFDTPGTHEYYQPTFVFQNGVGADPKYIAEATSHEAGHMLGLSHDGAGSQEYYQGQGAWAPIMGVGYYSPIVQWSNGDYAKATNKQDDLAVVTSNGAPLRADDHGNTALTATALGGPTFSTSGVIGTRSDVDVFSFTTANRLVQLQASPVGTSPNLDIKLEIRSSKGAVVASSSPASSKTSGDVAAGLGATLSAALAAGTYYVFVDGVGQGSPTGTGYSDYGSLGNYTLTGSVTNRAPTVALKQTTVSGFLPLTVAFDGSMAKDADGDALTYAWTFGTGRSAATAKASDTYANAGTYTAQLTVSDGQGGTASASVSVVVIRRDARVGSISISASRVGGWVRATAKATIVNAAGKPVGGLPVTTSWAVGDAAGDTPTFTTTGAGAVTSQVFGVVASGQTIRFCVTGSGDAFTSWTSRGASDCASWTAP